MSLSLSDKAWAQRPVDQRLLQALCQKFNLPSIVARVLLGRGVDLESAQNTISPTLRGLLPDPCCLKDMDKAIQRLRKAHEKGERIGLLGDYDVDGATSTSLLYRFLKHVGYEVEFYIPDRVKEGYGPNTAALETLHAKGCSVVLTLDCGTTSFAALDAAHAMGLDMIVVDHHVAEAKLPKAHAIINPNRLDEDPETTAQLGKCAAVGVSFMLIVGLNREFRTAGIYKDKSEPELFNYLDLVALGTVCDVMPLTGVNRAFVTQGLKVLAQRRNIGLAALGDQAGLDEKPAAYHLGFILGPRINAGGRVGESTLGTRLLIADDRLEAKEIAAKLDEFNKQRKDIEDTVLKAASEQAEEQRQKQSLVLTGEGWHEGVIGIVAGRMKDQWNKPTCVVTVEGDQAKGSARSIPGFDFGTFVHKLCHKGILTKGGGHAMAAGFSLHPSRISELHTELEEALSHVAQEVDLTPIIKLDGSLSLGAVTPATGYELEKLAPYGMGFSSPKFLFEEVSIAYSQIVGQKHIRLNLKQMGSPTVQAIAFRCVGTPLGDALQKGDELVDVIGTIKLDQWGGDMRAQLVVEDVRKTVAKTALKDVS